jgi:signal transduction histidine kinase
VRALEESLRRSELLSAMGRLIAGVAHEVRNPLFSISATLDAFEAEFGDRLEYKTYLEFLRKESRRLNAVMVELLEYGRPVQLDPSPMPLADLLRRAIADCTALANATGVELRLTMAEPGPLVHADVGRLEGALRNLLDNAIQHSPAGTAISISLDVDESTSIASCVIEDQGPGFRPEDLPRVFEPFFSRRRGGTGLGLSYVQRVITDHFGTVVARNASPVGASMVVELPLAARRERR